jgi:hypothetical protein
MKNNTIHQINWTFIIFMVSSYVILSVLLLKLFISNPNYNTYSSIEENRHLLDMSDDESISDIIETDNKTEDIDEIDEIDEISENNNILISIENNYINDIDSSYNIETND